MLKNEKSDNYAVIGNPVEHSLSPKIHHLFAEQTKQVIHYDKILAPLDSFDAVLNSFQNSGGKGINITVPFKEQAWKIADRCSARADFAQAANVILFTDDGKTYADNVDGIGLLNDLYENLKVDLYDRNILLLGAGGAARGVLAALFDKKPNQIVIANRTISKAEALADHFADFGNIISCGFEGTVLKDLHMPFDLVINSTSASLSGHALALPDNLLASTACCYDLMYGKEESPFMSWAKAQGAAIVTDGLGMLVEQAAESFSLWRGIRPETAPVIRYLRGQLN